MLTELVGGSDDDRGAQCSNLKERTNNTSVGTRKKMEQARFVIHNCKA
jgi:hypothetical protein